MVLFRDLPVRLAELASELYGSDAQQTTPIVVVAIPLDLVTPSPSLDEFLTGVSVDVLLRFINESQLPAIEDVFTDRQALEVLRPKKVAVDRDRFVLAASL